MREEVVGYGCASLGGDGGDVAGRLQEPLGADGDDGDAAAEGGDMDPPRRPSRAAPPTPRGSEELVAAVAAQLTALCDLRDR